MFQEEGDDRGGMRNGGIGIVDDGGDGGDG